MHYQLSELPNGLRIITETMSGIRSVGVGAWVDTGTRDETESEAGASHFLEHLLFKGSAAMSGKEIAERFDAMGAEANAFTSKDHTCFWARLLDADLTDGMTIIAEMLQRPSFQPRDIDSERQVVIEEINESEDDPADRAFERFTEVVFRQHPLERPVLGTRQSIKAMSRDDIAGYWERRYSAGSTVVALAGSVEHDAAVDLIGRLFGSWNGGMAERDHEGPTPHQEVTVLRRPIEQAHVVLGGVGLERGNPKRWAFEILNLVLGGGMASRLFNSIREERGLAYSVHSFRMAFADAGAWGVYAATAPENAPEVLRLISEELDSMAAEGVTEVELKRARGSIRGSLALAMEDANSRMVRLGRDEMVGAPHLSIDERLARIDAVTVEDVQAVAADVLSAPRVLSAAGPFDQADAEAWL